MYFDDEILDYIETERNILAKLDINSINSALLLLEETMKKNGNIYTFGNGGSAATASHFKNDFSKKISMITDKKYRIHCLNDNVPTLTAIANDISYDEIFRYQLDRVLEINDIVIAFSGSGNSTNVLLAVDYAKSLGNKIIGLTGYNGGKLGKLCDIHLHVPVMNMQITEDIHLMYVHLIVSLFNKHLQNNYSETK